MFAIIGEIRRAKAAGYRAGRAGAEFIVNPYRNKRRPLLSTFWGEGWEKGMKDRLRTPQWIVEMDLGGRWHNAWFDAGERPEIFSSGQAAQAAIDKHLKEWSVRRGHDDDAPTAKDFRVRQLGREFYAA